VQEVAVKYWLIIQVVAGTGISQPFQVLLFPVDPLPAGLAQAEGNIG